MDSKYLLQIEVLTPLLGLFDRGVSDILAVRWFIDEVLSLFDGMGQLLLNDLDIICIGPFPVIVITGVGHFWREVGSPTRSKAQIFNQLFIKSWSTLLRLHLADKLLAGPALPQAFMNDFNAATVDRLDESFNNFGFLLENMIVQ
jgi:hypothetical protein